MAKGGQQLAFFASRVWRNGAGARVASAGARAFGEISLMSPKAAANIIM